jgi:hypothetical protein
MQSASGLQAAAGKAKPDSNSTAATRTARRRLDRASRGLLDVMSSEDWTLALMLDLLLRSDGR